MPTITKLNDLSDLPKVYKNGRRSWIKSEVDQLAQLVSSGKSNKKIAREINRTKAAVQTKISLEGLRKRKREGQERLAA